MYKMRARLAFALLTMGAGASDVAIVTTVVAICGGTATQTTCAKHHEERARSFIAKAHRLAESLDSVGSTVTRELISVGLD